MAAAKAAALLLGGATVEVVAPRLSDEMKRLAEQRQITSNLREFEPADLEGVWLAIGATDDTCVQQRVYDEAKRRNILVCIVDDPARSDFIVPAVLRRGDLIVTVSTSGVAPALSARIRDYLGEILGEPYGKVLEDLKAVRERLKSELPEFSRRRKAWFRLVDTRLMPALRRGETPQSLSDYSAGKEENT